MNKPKIVNGEPMFEHSCDDCKHNVTHSYPVSGRVFCDCGKELFMVNSYEELKELIIALRFWFNNGSTPDPSTLWEDGETWKEKVQKAFEHLSGGSHGH